MGINNNSTNEVIPLNNLEYLSTAQIVECGRYPFSLGQIRHFLLMRHKNGLDTAIRKIGKRLYIRRDLFDQWIEEQHEGKNG